MIMNHLDEEGLIPVPDIEITKLNELHEYKPLRGWSIVMAVCVRGTCVGWIRVETLGYQSAREWMAAHA